MPFCPACHAEYRPGFDVCRPCGGVTLVDRLPESTELKPEELPASVPVGISYSVEASRMVEVDGRQIDPSRVFVLDTALELREALDEKSIPSALVPLEELLFPDQRARFEVRVRTQDAERAHAAIFERWQEELRKEGVEDRGPADVERCPACGAHVPLDVAECPDCGLVIGADSLSEPDGAR